MSDAMKEYNKECMARVAERIRVLVDTRAALDNEYRSGRINKIDYGFELAGITGSILGAAQVLSMDVREYLK